MKCPTVYSFSLLVVAGVLGTVDLVADDALFTKTIQPLLTQHCGDCHGAKEAKQGLVLISGSGNQIPAVLQKVDSLEKIASRVRAHTMPPPDEAEPLSEAERTTLLGWIDARIDASLAGEENPGRVTLRRLTKADYRNTIRDLLGVAVDTADFPSDDVAHGFDNLADVISLPPLLMERYAAAAEVIAADWYESAIAKDAAKQPTDAKTARDLAIQILLPLQSRAFRRPATELEKHYLLTFFDSCQSQEYSYAESMQACLMRVLISPEFLFRIEQDGPIGQNRQLNDYELAARLSYFLWSSHPDDELWQLAAQGKLQTGDALAQQVQRMLKDEKVRTGLVQNFAGQWLQTRRLVAIRPDPKAFPKFDDELRQAMEAETLLLFENIIREDRPVTELLDADYTFVNQRLAGHYGMSGIKGEAMQRVSLQDTNRRGVLTHASVLAINAHPTRTSPVLRGKWILEAMFGQPPPPPPADVPELEAVKVEGTLRERLATHRANPACASCHNRMDALGLAFENFDAVGAWRDKEAGAAIDAAGELPGGGKFAGPKELIGLVRKTEANSFRKNLAEKLFVYALGRQLGMYDRLPLRRVVTQTADAKDSFSSLVLAIIQSDAFQQRSNPGRIGVEKLDDAFVFDLSGNPDQQSVLKVKPNPHAPVKDAKQVTLELHSLQKLLKAGTIDGQAVTIGKPAGGTKTEKAFRYPMTVPVGADVTLSFLEGMISPQETSDDFLKPIDRVEDSDEDRVLKIANSSHHWNGTLTGPDNIRPGSLVSFDFDVRLVAKEKDSVQVFLATAGASNTSMFLNAGSSEVEGEGTHRLTQICQRNTNTADAWNNVVNLVIRTRTQTVIGNVSPLRVIRPQIGISDKSPIKLGPVSPGATAESKARTVFNAQKTTLIDQKNEEWTTVLYGAAVLNADSSRNYLVTSEHVGIILLGEHANLFTLVGSNATENGKQIKLIGSDEQPGLTGGKTPETESFQIRFQGEKQAGSYTAVVRIVTQAGELGTVSTGKAGEPAAGLHYVDIPVEAVVK